MLIAEWLGAERLATVKNDIDILSDICYPAPYLKRPKLRISDSVK